MNKVFVGLDVSKRKIDCALKVGDTYKMKVISNDESGYLELLKFLENNHIDINNHQINFCCEATNVYWEGLASFLFEKNFNVSVVNPIQIKRYSDMVLQRIKNDRSDARLIADYCENQKPELWQKPPVEVVQLEAYLKHLDTLKGIRVQISNKDMVSNSCISDINSVLLGSIDVQIIELERLIKDQIKQNSDFKNKYDLLRSIPSIGNLTASALLALLFDALKFKTSRHAVSFIGLSPREYQSGSSIRGRSSISKIGDSSIRKALYMPAMVAFSRMTVFQPFVEGMRKRGKPVKVIIVALMRKLVVIAHAILKSGQPFCEKRFLGI